VMLSKSAPLSEQGEKKEVSYHLDRLAKGEKVIEKGKGNNVHSACEN